MIFPCKEAAIAAARGLALTGFDEISLRGREMAEAASIVAAIPEVRAALVEFQRGFARSPGGAVLDGRDIGTVICPEACPKIFVTASVEARATRRALELQRPRRKGRLRRRARRHRQARRARQKPRHGALDGGQGRHRARYDHARRRGGVQGRARDCDGLRG